jgi:hypothetical protein
VQDLLTAAELQQRMEQVREDLRRSSAHLKQNAQTLADWRYHARRHPWAILAAAGAVGFLLVRRRAKPTALDAETLAKLAQQQRLAAQRDIKTAASNGLFSGLASALGKTVLRAGMAYVGQQVGQVLAGRVAAAAQPKATDDAAACGAARRVDQRPESSEV